MDKDFEKKVRQKRIRTAAVVVVVIAAIVYLIAGTKIEKADYTNSLNKEIEKAQALCDENKENVGNGAKQYAAYTLLKFEKDIAKAEAVAADEASEYNDKKLACETLQAQIKDFENGQNDPVLSVEEVKALMEQNGSEEVTTEIKAGKEIVYTVSGGQLEKAVSINLTAREEGPYYDEINSILAEKKLQGQVVSFYQDGTFGGKITVRAPMYSESASAGYVYKFDLEKGKLRFVSEAEVDFEGQTATFTVKEGGDYVVLTKKLHKDKKPVKAEEENQLKMEQESESNAESAEPDSGESHEVNKDAEEPPVEHRDEADIDEDEDVKDIENEDMDSETETEAEAEPELETEVPESVPEVSSTISVNLDIRCDTLSADLSKLREPALESYVPADGWILSVADLEVEKGSSVYDVLDMVCRNKGIHLEAVYTPNYGADYIEGINYLYEFDAGEQSGWMYMVNGLFPNYGCSDYILEDGDTVVWAYTCDMGKDLGKQ